MKTLTLVALIVLTPIAVHCCDWSRLLRPAPVGIHATRSISYRSPFSAMNYKPGLLMTSRYTTFSAQTLRVQNNFRRYTTEFDESAIFCRMENECLRRYNVKFSIHAGGYRE